MRANQSHNGVMLLKLSLGLLIFWAAWISVVFLTNLFAGLKLVHLLPGGWKVASNNYTLIQKTTERYATPAWMNGFLFAGVIAWQAAQVALFWRAVFSPTSSAVDLSFGVSLALWAAFILADEIFLAYPREGSHLEIFIAQLVSLLLIHQAIA